jgi:uncharacterized membrane protein YeiB
MPAASPNLTPCVRCDYPIELAIAPDTQATCPECGTLKTGADILRRAQRRTSQRKAAVVAFVFIAVHVIMVVMLAKFGNTFLLMRAVSLLVSILAALLVTIATAVGAGVTIVKLTKPERADAVLPAYVGVYLPALVIALAYAAVLFMLDALG